MSSRPRHHRSVSGRAQHLRNAEARLLPEPATLDGACGEQNVRRNRQGTRRGREGTATVELALILPVLLTFTLGTMDVCTALFLRETATIAAYEGARIGVARGQTNDDVTARIRELLDERNINYGNDVVTFGEIDFNTAETLDFVTVTVTIPAAGNTLIPSEFLAALNVRSSVTVAKEFANLQ